MSKIILDMSESHSDWEVELDIGEWGHPEFARQVEVEESEWDFYLAACVVWERAVQWRQKLWEESKK